MSNLSNARIKKLQAEIQLEKCEAYIIDSPTDLFYLLGLHLSLGRLLVTPQHVTLFVDGRYFEACRLQLSIDVKQTQGYGAGSIFEKEAELKNKKVGFDQNYTSYQEYVSLEKLGMQLVPLRSLVARLRLVKDPDELQKLKKAADLCREGYFFCLEQLKEGIEEREIVSRLKIFWLQKGGGGVGFPPIIAFGENAALPHHRPGTRKLQKGDTVLIDIGVVLDNYHSDMTRVVFHGETDQKMHEVYAIVYEAQQKAIACALPGAPLREVDRAARSYIASRGYEKEFSHGLGHGIGLEVHEGPRLTYQGEESLGTLEENMVVTIEPGIYLPGIGGVRLEDSVVITKEGAWSLTNIPITQEAPKII
jgi:Xaa-Pro aminopeptidase